MENTVTILNLYERMPQFHIHIMSSYIIYGYTVCDTIIILYDCTRDCFQ